MGSEFHERCEGSTRDITTEKISRPNFPPVSQTGADQVLCVVCVGVNDDM